MAEDIAVVAPPESSAVNDPSAMRGLVFGIPMAICLWGVLLALGWVLFC